MMAWECALVLCASLVSACRARPDPAPSERPASRTVRAEDSPEPPTVVLRDAQRSAEGSRIQHVIVIALENRDAAAIYTDAAAAPYIHSLLGNYARAENFVDVLPLE